MSEVTGIAVAANADGRLELVAASNLLSQPGGAWHAWQTTPNGAWTGWRSLGKPGNGLWWNNAPALARNADGRLEVLVVSADGTVWHAWQVPGAGWSGWSSLGKPGNQNASGIAALAANADGRLEAFVIGEDRAVWHRWQLPRGGHWSAWSRLGQPGGRPVDYLAVGANADGRLELFVPGDDYAMWHRWQTAPNNGWSAWSSLGQPGEEQPTGWLKLAHGSDGRLELFVVTLEGNLWHAAQVTPGGHWAQWSSLDGPEGEPGIAEVGVGANADGRLEVMATLLDSTDLWHRSQTAPDDGWSDWSSLGSVATGRIAAPTLAADADGRLELFLQMPETGGLYQLTQTEPNAGWNVGRSWPHP
jgi:hypothetical protein